MWTGIHLTSSFEYERREIHKRVALHITPSLGKKLDKLDLVINIPEFGHVIHEVVSEHAVPVMWKGLTVALDKVDKPSVAAVFDGVPLAKNWRRHSSMDGASWHTNVSREPTRNIIDVQFVVSIVVSVALQWHNFATV